MNGNTVKSREDIDTATTYSAATERQSNKKSYSFASIPRQIAHYVSTRNIQQNSNSTNLQSFEDGAKWYQKIFLSYLSPVLQLGSREVLQEKDLRVPSRQDLSMNSHDRIVKTWKEEIARVEAENENRIQKASKTNKPPKLLEPNFTRALFSAAKPRNFFIALFLYGIAAVLQFLPVMILNDLVKYLGGFINGAPTYQTIVNPWVEVALLAITPTVVSLLQNNSQVLLMHISVFSRSAISTLLYQKAMLVSATGRSFTSTGQVVNLMSNDTNQVQQFFNFITYTIFAPLQIIISIVLIFQQIGNATWIGVAFMACFGPLNTVIFHVLGKYRRKTLFYSDKRVKLMNEILNGIRIIKFYAWEKPFQLEVNKLREKELKALTKVAYVTAVGFSLILLSAPIIQPVIVFACYIKFEDEPLDAAKAFTTIALFNMMRFPFAFLPMGLLQYIQSKISIKRIETYLLLPDLVPYVQEEVPKKSHDPNDKGAACGSITIQNGNFSWIDEQKQEQMTSTANVSSKKLGKRSILKKSALDESNSSGSGKLMTLKDINLTIEAGSLVAVVGSVGSGKSSLLSAILGEMEPTGTVGKEPKVFIPRDPYVPKSNMISYCSQTSWVVNDTLRGNILFGRPYHKARYEQIVSACALVDDFKILPAGDMTEIGERGINLSGGQKARVSLARAIYSSDVKILLLDDPLSAVDAHVGEHMFANALSGEIVKDVTRVLVTHHVHRLRFCDKVIVMEEGKVKDYGTYDELVSRGIDFMGAVESSKLPKTEEEEKNKGVSHEEEQPANTITTVSHNSVEVKDLKGGGGGKDEAEEDHRVSKSSHNSEFDTESSSISSVNNDDSDIQIEMAEENEDNKKNLENLKKSGKELVTKEERSEGSVSFRTYLKYARSGGIFIFSSIFLIQALGRAAEIGSTFWLSHWADVSVQAEIQGDPLDSNENTYYINMYAAFALIGIAGLTVRSMVMAIHRMRASKKIHVDLTKSILRAPISFFDITPTGRVLNRFAADMDKIDLELTSTFSQIVNTVYQVLGAVAGILAGTKGAFLIPLLPMTFIYHRLQKWFRKSSTELQRITNIANSPIFSHFSQVLNGTSTIRAYQNQDRFFNHFEHSFDKMINPYVLTQTVSYWLSLRLDFLGGLIGAMIGALSVATAPYGFIPAGWLGLSLSNSIDITNFLKHGVRMIATLEAQMNSVERVLHYTEKVDPEAPDTMPNDPKPSSWPSQGAIHIARANMRYRDGPLVLKDITLQIKGGEKVGVVGRTGSGKSSLMILLFRICEIDKDGGKVEIDGIDTRAIGTDILRQSLSIIPQDPVMFSNTVRYNIDPFGKASDKEIWETLEKCQLSQTIASLPLGLDDMVAEGGENFSQGQRQLLCIARSLLRKPKILIMDEATSSIDNETDALIQHMIRENFADSTVLTIAHRLNTIMDSDRVLVLDQGNIVEFDAPSVLLDFEDGVFKGMVDKHKASSGEKEENHKDI